MKFNLDSRDCRIDTMPLPNAQSMAAAQKIISIERRSGKDRRIHYAEKRKIDRTIIGPGSYIMLRRSRILKYLWPKEIRFAMIVDISLIGLGAHYVARDIFNYKQNVLSIATTDQKISTDFIPFRVINDKLVTNLPDNKQLRRCGIKFENISDSHKIEINNFIQKYGS